MVKNKYKIQKSLEPKKDDVKKISSIIGQNEFEGLIGFEEISTCTLMKKTRFGSVQKTFVKDGKIIKNKKKKNKKNVKEREVVDKSTDNKKTKKRNVIDKSTDNKKTKKRNLNSGFTVTDLKTELQNLNENINKRKKMSIDQKKAATADTTENKPKRAKYDKQVKKLPIEPTDISELTIWKEIFTPEPVLKSLAKLGFNQPTEIQRLTLPAAIKGRKDIIGAAETGSGKTLAFGIPIIHGIIRDIEKEKEGPNNDSGVEISDEEDVDNSPQTESDMDDDENVPSIEEGIIDNTDSDEESEFINSNNDIGCVKVINNADFSEFMDVGEDVPITVLTKPLRALIITPTRELAIQIKGHLDAVLDFTPFKTAVIVGGVAQEKQERLLKRCPEIVVGTPGRLWELIQMGNPHMSKVNDIRYLVIDETDRMIEKGHFQELQDLLELINSDENAKAKRQTFVFSATLTMVHSAPKRVNSKNKSQKLTSKMKVENLSKLIGVKVKPKVIDVTRSFGTAQTLTEARINCPKDEKDFYLYYFLKQYPGRTLVFCNSIDCVRRLQNLFTILKCEPQSLHASMHQKQRLKSLEKFSECPRTLLLATDVAARGLDIPNIQHVLHYQVPRTAETYVHRSGRTARACQEGLSILLIDPTEITKYRQLCTTLNRATDLPPFPIDIDLMSQVKERVSLGRTVEKMEHHMRKERVEDNWLKKTADEAELILDDDDGEEEYDGSKKHEASKSRQTLKINKSQLEYLLAKSLVPSNFSGKYPTQTGALVTPANYQINCANPISTNSESSALDVMKKEKETFTNLLSKVKFKPQIKKPSKKKYKGFAKRRLKKQQEKEKYAKQMEQDAE